MSARDARGPALTVPASVLVIVTRRIGDVLLATPLISSIKAAWPQAQIDALVFAGTEGVLSANPDLRHIHAVAERPRFLAHAGLVARLLRRYDIALSCLTGDRPTLYAWIAGRWRAGFVEGARGARWKPWLLSRAVAFDGVDTHTVAMNLALAGALGIPLRHEVVARWSVADETQVKARLGDGGRLPAYAVLHPHPKFNYKMWHAEGWIGLVEWLARRGFATVFTGGGESAERDFVTALAARMPRATINLAGKLSLAQAACLIAGARLYVGPDTATTHIAAALGIPTVALYGPSNPVRWGPWPREFAGSPSPWRRTGTQAAGNVQLVQGAGACVPCMGEGCDRHVASWSDCLLQLPLAAVIAAVERALAHVPARQSN